MKKSILFFAFILSLNYSYAQEIDYNNLSQEYTDITAQALNKVNAVTKKWFADAALQHPAGSFNIIWTKEKLKEKFSTTDINKMGDLFVLMMAYQRMANKEARQERRMTSPTNATDSIAKTNNVATDKTKITQMQKEAKEKQNQQMEAANVNVVTGVIAGSSTIGTGKSNSNSNGSASGTSKADSLKLVKPPTNPQELKTQKVPANVDKSNDSKKVNNTQNNVQNVTLKKLLEQMAILKKTNHI